MNMISYLELVLTQVLTVLSLNDGSVVKSVSEYNKDQGWLDGGFDYWDDRNNNGIVDTKDGIYWHTESKKNNYWGQSFVDRRWNHYGILAPLDSSRPNHS